MKYDLKDLASKHLEIACKMLSKDDQLLPIFTLLKPNGETVLVGTHWGNEEEKQKTLAAMRALMKANGIVAYAHTCEAWMAVVSPDTDKAIANLTPSQRNDRREVVIAVAADHLDTEAKAAEILRDADGNISTKPVPEFSENGAKHEGRMTTLLRAET